jgi:hypothetical protein
MLFFVCLITVGQCYLFEWIAPKYSEVSSDLIETAPLIWQGWILLLVCAIIIIALAFIIRRMNKRKPAQNVLGLPDENA